MDIRNTYQKKASAQLREWQEWIEQIRAESPLFPGRRQAEKQKMIENLENCHQIASLRLDELRSSREDGWDLAKQGVERAMIELKQALDQSGSKRYGRFVELQEDRTETYGPFFRKG